LLEVDYARDLSAHTGQTIGVSPWLEITEERIARFADVTGDHQWIHIDVARAKAEMPGGRVIAHGYLLLSLLPTFTPALYVIRNRKRALNYGLNKVRFTAPVPAGSHIRLALRVLAVEAAGEATRVIWENTLEIEGAERPAMIVESISLFYD
jgi:acyl dehydratase